MNLLILLVYLALCVVLFKICRVPLGRRTAPVALVVGLAMVGGLILALDFYHPRATSSQQHALAVPVAPAYAGLVREVLVEDNQRVARGEPLLRIASADAHGSDYEDSRDGSGEFTLNAPFEGYVTGLSVVSGSPVGPDLAQPPLRVVDGSRRLVAWFEPKNHMQLASLSRAEVAFDVLPGRVFTGRLLRIDSGSSITPGVRAGLAADGVATGRLPVMVEIEDPRFDAHARSLPAGARATVAVYGDALPELATVRKVLLRMVSWLAYLYPLA